MLKRKALNRIFLTTVIFFVVFTLYNLKEISINNEIKKSSNNKEEIIYTLNDDNYVSKTSIYVSKVLTLEDKIREKLETMVEENNKNALLPSYFNPILPENTKVLDVIVEDSLVKVYFSKELLNITEEQSEKMIEAIVYTITNENILGVEIYVNDSMLKYVPHTKKELPAVLTKDIGINKTYEIFKSNDISKIVMTYYTSSDNNSYHEVPVTKYVNDEREKLEIIFEELENPSLDKKLINLLENIKINSYKIYDKKIIIDINKELSSKEEFLVLKSIFDNYDKEKVEIFVNGVKNIEKTKKDIEN